MNDELLLKYLTDQADKHEKEEVRDWLAVFPQGEQELARIKNIWVLAGIGNETDPQKKEQAIRKIMEKIRVINKKPVRKTVSVKWLKYAAVLVFSIGLGVSGYFISGLQYSTAGYTEIIAPKGERSKVVLPDGSTVQLNSGSRLKFNSSFQSGKRDVFLQGEAFFDVVRDKSRPFTVEAGIFQVEVLGTSFNVSSYPDDRIASTYLESGKVKIRIEGEKDIFLAPSEIIEYEKTSGKITKQAVNDHRFSDWTKGILNIKGETIEELAKKLERRFNIEIRFGDNAIRDRIYSGTIQDEDLNTVLEALAFASSLKYEKQEKAVILSSEK
ncbi:MAG: FecR domain-containing protein [Prolixibacteraceae bacterium]|jgi:ferric-dicitrate binding protein FerR (iron transport regulator)|nr:FecR domain-containing protein [Prolixibacteraceae bacterium]